MTEALRYERIIAAPPDVAFDAFTSADGQVAFYGQDDRGWIVRSESDVRVGGDWTILFGPSPKQLYRHHDDPTRHPHRRAPGRARPRRPERVRPARATHPWPRRASHADLTHRRKSRSRHRSCIYARCQRNPEPSFRAIRPHGGKSAWLNTTRASVETASSSSLRREAAIWFGSAHGTIQSVCSTSAAK